MTAAEAKDFLISKILQEADRQHVELTETEKQMLWWTEVHPEPHIADLRELAERFDRECRADSYETKIEELAEAAFDSDKAASTWSAEKWKAALQALSEEDHYLNTLLPGGWASGDDISDFPPGPTKRGRLLDYLLYVGIGIGVVVAAVVIAVLTS